MFVSIWNTENGESSITSNSNQVSLPLESTGTYDFFVNWGDGNEDRISTWNDPACTHTYAIPGTYKIAISGVIEGFRFNGAGDASKIIEITRWGPLRLGNNNGYFKYISRDMV